MATDANVRHNRPDISGLFALSRQYRAGYKLTRRGDRK